MSLLEENKEDLKRDLSSDSETEIDEQEEIVKVEYDLKDGLPYSNDGSILFLTKKGDSVYLENYDEEKVKSVVGFDRVIDNEESRKFSFVFIPYHYKKDYRSNDHYNMNFSCDEGSKSIILKDAVQEVQCWKDTIIAEIESELNDDSLQLDEEQKIEIHSMKLVTKTIAKKSFYIWLVVLKGYVLDYIPNSKKRKN